jgi:hypothetical protein
MAFKLDSLILVDWLLSVAGRPPMVVPPMVRPPFIPGMPMTPIMPPVPPPVHQPIQPPAPPSTRPSDAAGDEEPLAKRAKTEDQLISENDFLATNKVRLLLV